MRERPLGFGAITRAITARPTVEAELTALAYGPKEAAYLSKLTMELGFKSFISVTINCGRTRALHHRSNATYSLRPKHIALRFVFVRELWSRPTKSPFTTWARGLC